MWQVANIRTFSNQRFRTHKLCTHLPCTLCMCPEQSWAQIESLMYVGCMCSACNQNAIQMQGGAQNRHHKRYAAQGSALQTSKWGAHRGCRVIGARILCELPRGAGLGLPANLHLARLQGLHLVRGVSSVRLTATPRVQRSIWLQSRQRRPAAGAARCRPTPGRQDCAAVCKLPSCDFVRNLAPITSGALDGRSTTVSAHQQPSSPYVGAEVLHRLQDSSCCRYSTWRSLHLWPKRTSVLDAPLMRPIAPSLHAAVMCELCLQGGHRLIECAAHLKTPA